MTERVLTDRMKTVLIEETGGELHFNTKSLGFAAYYGFLPQVCRPYRPETKGKLSRPFVLSNRISGQGLASIGSPI